MKKCVIFLFIVFLSISSYSQYTITIEAQVLEKDTKQPIPFTNIGFLEKGIGTVSRDDGTFILTFDEDHIKNSDVLQFSMVGYESQQFTLIQLARTFKKENIIYLSKNVESLDEVLLSSNWGKSKPYGHLRTSKKIIGYWKDDKALGGEIATLIKLKKEKQKLTKLHFDIIENVADSIKVRVNIYDYKKRKPGDNLLYTPIFQVLKNKSGKQSIDLSPYNIIVDDDIVVSLELVEVYGEHIEFALAGSFDKGTSFLRYVSQDKWVPRFDNSIAFSVDSRPYQVSNATQIESIIKEDIVIYWDTSLSLNKRDKEKELKLLEAYLKKVKNKNVTVRTFANAVIDEQLFQIPQDYEKLFDFLKYQKYLGATRLDQLELQENNIDIYLLFSDGIHTISDGPSEYSSAPVHIISSNKRVDASVLSSFSEQNDGHYIDLSKLTVNKALERLTSGDEVSFSNTGFEDANRFLLKGTISFKENKLQGCYVSVDKTLNETQSNNEGEFEILVQQGDVLNFEFINMLPKKIVVTDKTSIEVALDSEYESLNEVLLAGKIKKEAILTSKEERLEQERRSGDTQYSLDAEDLRKSAVYLSDLIRGRFPGLKVSGSGNDATFQTTREKTGKPIPSLFIVDGIKFLDPPNFLDIALIKNITYKPSLSTATKYGALARGGVIEITTISPSFDKKNLSALATGNNYDETVIFFNKNQNLSNISKTFDGKSFEESYSIFKNAISKNPTDITIYLEYYNHIKTGNTKEDSRILSTILEVSENNTRVMRSLGYYLEKYELNELASLVYQKIQKIAPNEVQSYLDNASGYVRIGEYQKSFEIYKLLLNNNFEAFSLSEDALTIAETEIKYLLTKYKDKVTYNDVPFSFIETVQTIDLRYVVYWSNPQLEFELQFVNPNNKFYEWSHTLINSDGVFNEDLKNGLLSRQFILDDEIDKGEWIMNITGKSEDLPSIPGFLKIEAYRDYGTPNEKREITIVPFAQLDKKYTIDSVTF